MRRLLLIFAASSAFGLAAARPDANDLFRRLSSPFVSGWVLADFNGDSTVDLATSPPGRYDGRGYAHEVSVRLSESQHSSFTFRSRSSNVRLSARDIDGDHDRDIVILEGLSQEPIGVWLNDGAGNFTEGDLAQFRYILGRRDPGSFRSPELAFKVLFAIPEERVQPAVPRVSLVEPDRTIEILSREGSQVLRDFRWSNLRARAPPRNS